MKIFISSVLLVFCGLAHAGPHNTNYVGVKEVKVWKTYIDVYSESVHQCEHGDTTRYVLSKEEKEMFSIALSAMVSGMKANINYFCGSDGKPQIDGIRVKP